MMILNRILRLRIWLLLLGIGKQVHSSVVVNITEKINSTNGRDLECFNSTSDVRRWEYTNPAGNTTVLSETDVTYTVTSLSQVGEYRCLIDDTSVINFTVAYIATPVIPNGAMLWFVDGEVNRSVTCYCAGCYPAVTFTWGRETAVRSNDFTDVAPETFPIRIELTTTHILDPLNSSSLLKFVELRKMRHANYRCLASNAAGNKHAITQIHIRDRYAIVWPLIGITAEVLVLIIIMAAIEWKKRTSSAKVGMKDSDHFLKPPSSPYHPKKTDKRS